MWRCGTREAVHFDRAGIPSLRLWMLKPLQSTSVLAAGSSKQEKMKLDLEEAEMERPDRHGSIFQSLEKNGEKSFGHN